MVKKGIRGASDNRARDIGAYESWRIGGCPDTVPATNRPTRRTPGVTLLATDG